MAFDLVWSLIIEQYELSFIELCENFRFGGNVTESLILAQNERWRHGLGMQVERSTCREWRKGE